MTTNRQSSIYRAIVTACVCATVAVGLSACGGSNKATAIKNPKDITIGFVTANEADPFYVTMQYGAQQEATRLGVKLIWQGPSQFSPGAQLPFVNAVLSQKPNAFILSPTDPAALLPAVLRAKGMGIPVLTADTGLSDTSSLVSHISGDNAGGAALAGRLLGQAIGGRGQTYVMDGVPAVGNDQLRLKGFLQGIKQFPGMQNVGVQYSDEQPTTAETQVQAVLQHSPGIKGMFCTDTPTCVGTVRGLAAIKKLGQVKVVAYDAEPEVVRAVGAHQVIATIAQQPAKEAALAVDYAVAAVKGNKAAVKSSVLVPDVPITASTFAQTKQYAYRTSP